MTDSRFLLKAVSLLDDSVSLDEIAALERIVRERIAERRRGILRETGLCLGCQSVHICYGPLAIVHKQRGNAWLDATAAKWQRPPSVDISWRDVKVNGLKRENIIAYLCADCMEGIDEVYRFRIEQGRQKELHAIDVKHEILIGERKASPAKRFWLLQEFPHHADALRAMPYRKFLKTTYWEIVRNYVRYKRGYRCEMCATGDPLNVHHKTYEHHGDEHRFLEDLILLCRECHAKFHDKLIAQGV